MKMHEAELAYKNDRLVLYQDALCSVTGIDYEYNRVMIREGEREKFGEFISRYVIPEQIELVEETIND